MKNCNNNTNNLFLDDVPYEDVSGFQYISSLVTNNNDITVEIKKNNCLCYPCLRDTKQYIYKKVKITTHKTIIKPIVQYGSDT
jgi:hypothetical protein